MTESLILLLAVPPVVCACYDGGFQIDILRWVMSFQHDMLVKLCRAVDSGEPGSVFDCCFPSVLVTILCPGYVYSSPGVLQIW
jgi:hypothetical protein